MDHSLHHWRQRTRVQPSLSIPILQLLEAPRIYQSDSALRAEEMMRTILPHRAKDCASQPRVKIMHLSCCLNLGVSQPHVHNPRKRIIWDQPAGAITRIISTTTSSCLRHDRVEGGPGLAAVPPLPPAATQGGLGGKAPRQLENFGLQKKPHRRAPRRPRHNAGYTGQVSNRR